MQARLKKEILPILFDALGTEWARVVQRIPEKYRRWMKMPQFAINEEMRCWGMWHSEPINRLVINASLLDSYPWYALCDVMAHEVTHQLCDMIRKYEMRGLNESDHGALFQECCKYTGARPCASDDYPLLSEMIFKDDEEEGAQTEQARLAVKIRKLLALSESSNQAEAEAALLKARELSAKYDIDLESAGKHNDHEDEFYTIGLGEPIARIGLDDTLLANLLGQYFNVAVFWNWTAQLGCHNAPNDKFPQQLYVGGTRKNLRIASYVYDCVRSYLKNAVYALPTQLLAKVLTHKRAMRDFRLGVIRGFESTLKKQSESPLIQQAMVLADRTKLDEYIMHYCPGLHTTKRRVVLTHQDSYDAGVEAGKKMHISPAVERAHTTAAPRQLPQ
jgi:hypothetical protein